VEAMEWNGKGVERKKDWLPKKGRKDEGLK
jgi:hypothetical protein